MKALKNTLTLIYLSLLAFSSNAGLITIEVDFSVEYSTTTSMQVGDSYTSSYTIDLDANSSSCGSYSGAFKDYCYFHNSILSHSLTGDSNNKGNFNYDAWNPGESGLDSVGYMRLLSYKEDYNDELSLYTFDNEMDVAFNAYLSEWPEFTDGYSVNTLGKYLSNAHHSDSKWSPGYATVYLWQGQEIFYAHTIQRGIRIVSNVPEPSTLPLLGLGIIGLGFVRRRRA